MDIRERIRQQFSTKKVIKEATKGSPKWDPEQQPNIYQLANFLKKSGYRLVDVLEHTKASEIPGVELIIEPISPGHLYPEIHHDYKEGNFYAKVTEHGMLVASDVEEIVKGYTTALGVLEHLESLAIETLEINVEDNEG